MKKILFLFFILSNFMFAYDPTAAAASESWESTYSTDHKDVLAYQRELNEDVITPQDEVAKEATELKKVNIKDYLQSSSFNESSSPLKNKYFITNFEFDTSDLYCPPLQEQYKNGYGVLIENVNTMTGEITCSVFEKQFQENETVTNASSKKVLNKVYTKTFTNSNYVQRIEVNEDNVPENLVSAEALEAAKLYQDKLKDVKLQIKYNYQNVTTSNNQMYLDLSDVIDAVFTMDSNVIDIEQSLQQKTLIFQDGYSSNYTNPVIHETAAKVKEFLNSASKDLNKTFGDWMPVVFEKSVTEQTIEEKKSDAVILLDTSLNSVLYFVVKYYQYFDTIFATFLILIFSYLAYSVINFYIENWNKENIESKYLQRKSGFVIFSSIVLLTLSMSSNTAKFELEGEEIEINTNTFQTYTTLLSNVMNDTADTLTLGVIDAYANNIFANSALSATAIKASARDLIKYKKIKEINANVVNDCIDIYSIAQLKADYPDFYANVKDNLFVPEEIAQKSRKFSVYNSLQLDGYIANLTKFNQNSLALNACFNARKDLNVIARKIDFLETRLEAFNNMSLQEMIYAQKQFILDKLYNDFYKYGYITVANINLIESYRKIMELPSKKGEEWSNILLNFDAKQIVSFISENSVLMLTIGEPVQNLAAKAAKVVTDAGIGWIPFGIGSALSNATSGAAGFLVSAMYTDFIDEIVPSLRGLFLWGLNYFMFMIMFVAKFVAFWLIPFVALYVFMSGMHEKSGKVIIKIVTTFIKPVIFIPIVFLTAFLLDFAHNFLFLGLDVMKNDLTFSPSIWNTVATGVIVSVAKIFVIAIEFIIAYQFAINGTRTVLETFEIGSRDIADVISDSVANTFQNKIVK